MLLPLRRGGRIAVAAVVLATVVCEIAVALAYRNSTDGQTPVLWVLIALFGAMAIGVVRVADEFIRRNRDER